MKDMNTSGGIPGKAGTSGTEETAPMLRAVRRGACTRRPLCLRKRNDTPEAGNEI